MWMIKPMPAGMLVASATLMLVTELSATGLLRVVTSVPPSSAGLPSRSACVKVGPLLLASGPRRGFTFVMLCADVPVNVAPEVFPMRL